MSKNAISNSVIRRLPRYYRFLGELEKNGYDKISSRELAEKMSLTASQIRQDFNCFGEFGQQGYGYNVSELRRQIGIILGLDSKTPMILIGAGNLGTALASHLDFGSVGFRLVGIFDTNKEIIGKKIGDIAITDIERLPDFCKTAKPVSAILCVPDTVVEKTVESLVNLGIRAFWNFTHCELHSDSEDIIAENVHLGDSLTTLSYRINSEKH